MVFVLEDDYGFQLGTIQCFFLVVSGINQDGVVASRVESVGTRDVKAEGWLVHVGKWVGVLLE